MHKLHHSHLLRLSLLLLAILLSFPLVSLQGQAVDDLFHANLPEKTYHFDILGNDDLMLEDNVQIQIVDSPTYGSIEVTAKEIAYTSLVTSFVDLEYDYFSYILFINGEQSMQADVTIVLGNQSEECIEDCIWPGDTNNDGIVNAHDILPLGLGYGFVGIARENQGIYWEGHSCDDWATYQTDGTNYKYIDCDGNGYIDSYDKIAIEENYNFMHGKTEGDEEVAADFSLYLEVDQWEVEPGEEIDVRIMLGEADFQAEDVYGLVFSLTFNEEIVAHDEIEVDFQDGWLSESGSDISIFKVEEGVVDAGITLTNQTNSQTNFGQIGNLKIVMEDVIDGIAVLNLGFSDVTVINRDNDELEVNGMDLQVDIVLGVEELREENIKVYPVPASRQLNIQTIGEPIEDIQLINLNGQEVALPKIEVSTNDIKVELPDVLSGVYLVKIITNSGILMRKVSILQ